MRTRRRPLKICTFVLCFMNFGKEIKIYYCLCVGTALLLFGSKIACIWWPEVRLRRTTTLSKREELNNLDSFPFDRRMNRTLQRFDRSIDRSSHFNFWRILFVMSFSRIYISALRCVVLIIRHYCRLFLLPTPHRQWFNFHPPPGFSFSWENPKTSDCHKQLLSKEEIGAKKLSPISWLFCICFGRLCLR